MYGVVMLSQMSNCASFGALRDGVAEPAAEGVDVALVASGLDLAGDRRAVHADDQARVSCSFLRAHASTTNGISASGAAEPNSAIPHEQA